MRKYFSKSIGVFFYEKVNKLGNMSSSAAQGGGGAPPPPTSYAFDANFFTRFTKLRMLRNPLHHEESGLATRVPFYSTGSAVPGAPGEPDQEDIVIPEDEKGRAAMGAYGVVFSAIDSATGHKVAIKFSKKKLGKYGWEDAYVNEHRQIVEEVYTHAAASRLPCPSILKMLYACEVDVDLDSFLYSAEERAGMLARGIALPGKHKRHAFVLEYASGHNLRDILANHEGVGTLARVESPVGGAEGGFSSGAGAAPSPLPDRRPYMEKDKRDLARQILEALAALHGAGLTHRDLKPENILLRHAPLVQKKDLHNLEAAKQDIHLDLAVFDFGLAIDAARGDVRGQPIAPPDFVGNIGSCYFLPPEVLARFGEQKTPENTCYKPPMDIFAAGVTLYLMLLGDSHDEQDDGSFSRTWSAGSSRLLDTWDHFRVNLLPFGQRYERVYVKAWKSYNYKMSLLPGLRMAQPTPTSRAAAAAAAAAGDDTAAMEAAIAEEHYKRSQLLSEKARDLLVRMLHPDPAQRITAAAALAHPWFSEHPAELCSHADPAALEATANRQAQILRASKAGRVRFQAQLVSLVKIRRFLARHMEASREDKLLLSTEQVQTVLARFHAREVERRRAAGSAPSAGGAAAGGAAHPVASPSILHVRGLSQEGLGAVLGECGVEAGVVAQILPKLWAALADCADPSSGLVREADFLTLLPLLSDPPKQVESALSLYFDLWDSNEDGSLSDEELVTLMEAVQGFLPPTASAAERDARHAELVHRARDMTANHPSHSISKE